MNSNSRHYGVAIEPARPYKPQDKSKVELGVKAIQRWILMRLRHHTFFSVDGGYKGKVLRKRPDDEEKRCRCRKAGTTCE